ncbi:hypothetical protein Emtol_1237 [Emticicia oligotrophica DSM 17448]|uniref:Uncharacterized protein n=1 Tax=Emticicia oligotrophica (strain DSM 17448 / CIP 109782 / MTCC 6937 / GPTSA100-15) TaxID=929562 RepID=A0ABM5MZ26_EMTOG|nr:hypothetical protein Emtol_1237 [Emticicia oligotrophica DSM 17448]
MYIIYNYKQMRFEQTIAQNDINLFKNQLNINFF